MCNHTNPNEHPDPPSFSDDFPPVGLSLDDAPSPVAEVEDRCHPLPSGPDWRLLLQTDHWVHADGRTVRLVDMTETDLVALHAHITDKATVLHAQAAECEQAATSSAVAWMFHNLNIALIGDIHPLIWLGTTPLMRWLTDTLHAPPRRTWDDPSSRCTDDGCDGPW